MLGFLAFAFTLNLVWTSLVFVILAGTEPVFTQSASEFQRRLQVDTHVPVLLDVQLSKADVQIAYSRDEQVSITATVQAPIGAKASSEFLASALTVEQQDNHIRISHSDNAGTTSKTGIVCRIDVPYRTEVRSIVQNGKQTVTGILGPVKTEIKNGDVKISYISKSVEAESGSGNLALQMIGGRVEARTGNGNISCIRAAEGVIAETGDGDIILAVVGPSKATVKNGIGRIEVGGARGSFSGSTAGGDLHVKAIPHDDWLLNTASGNIRVELPPAARFEVDATANLGEILIDRNDIALPNEKVRRLHQKVNGGGKHIDLRSNSGNIVIR